MSPDYHDLRPHYPFDFHPIFLQNATLVISVKQSLTFLGCITMSFSVKC